ncbi:MAG: transglutaminaseTgpA domain-containing protein, partial [Planctomycetota bacterium]|nr:transglutaminaseTgpA domain-containing protein [Planctomycetota bacterium]
MIQQKNFRRLSFCFTLFSAIAAILLGLGQESWYLPILVCTCALSAYFCTDRLGLIYLPKFLVYIGMIAGALLAGYEYLTQMRANQLLWVGNLLVYVQLPLYFQRKEKRVFEQWGIFLLLELVVATLVNDNVLYGVLMLPVLAVGSAALIALAEFASYQRHNETHSESTSIFTRLLHWIGVEKVPSRGVSGLQLFASDSQSNFGGTQEFRPGRWTSSIIPFALSMLLFSVGYFYMLPRLYSESFDGEGLGWGGSRIGFSEQISLQFVGELLRNESPAFRMSMTNESSTKTYRPNQPPYIRGTVVHRYIDGPGRGLWQPSDRDNYSPKQNDLRDLITQQECDAEMTKLRDCVRVHVAERSPFGPVVCSLPPYAQIEKSPFLSGRRDWRLLDPRSSFAVANPPKRRYSFLTYAFVSGQESPVLEDQADVYEEDQADSFSSYGNSILDFPASLELIRPEINRMLSLSEKPLDGKLTKAIFLENHLADSQQFEYTLSLTGPRDSGIDPIADFLLNKKRGHCQYFASALALMLRSQGIPTRLVVGFRPSEYNEIGGYFQVSQSHAHVWVEAYFTLDEIDQAPPDMRMGIPVPKWSKKGIWLRLDPTPPVEGSNAGGSFRSSNSQTFDAMQDFWDEMVINMDKSRQGG